MILPATPATCLRWRGLWPQLLNALCAAGCQPGRKVTLPKHKVRIQCAVEKEPGASPSHSCYYSGQVQL